MYDVVNMPDLVQRYFSSNLWLGAFIISVIYLFFRANSARKRAIIAAGCGFFLIINAFVIRIYTELGENATFYRQLWVIPTAAIIGVAIVDLVRILPKWFLKIPAIIAFAIFLWFANQEYIRCRDQVFSRNAKMVQGDVITLAEKLEQVRAETGKNVLYVVCPIGYSRPHGDMPAELNLLSGFLSVSNSSILNDAEHDGEAQLMLENPDVPYIMSTCCSKGIDYVIVSNKENAKEIFEQSGYNAVASTDAFLVYPCSGYKGYRQDLNNWGQISWKSYYDENGNPEQGAEGWSTVRYSYDGKGLLESKMFFDQDHIPVLISGRYETRNEYNSERRLVKESYFDPNGNPINRTDLDYASREIEYDKTGRIVSEHYYDINGTSKICGLGYASYIKELNEAGITIGEKYFDSEDRLIGEVNENHHAASDNIFRFFHATDGIEVQDNTIKMSTCVQNNRFNLIHLQLYDSKGSYLLELGRTSTPGTVMGRYTHELPDGLYMLRLKGNTNLKDECIDSFVYLTEGDTITYQYDLFELTDNYIVIKDISATIDPLQF